MGIRDLHFIPDQKDIMAKAFRELIGVGPSTASTKDSVLVIIDAQNEYANGQLKTENVASTRKAISSLREIPRCQRTPRPHCSPNSQRRPCLHARHRSGQGVR